MRHRVWQVLLLVLLLVAVNRVNAGGTGGGEVGEVGFYYPYQTCQRDESLAKYCPACPPAPEFTACEAKCPQGYVVYEQGTDLGLGLISCKSVDDSDKMFPRRCYYFNDKCFEVKTQQGESEVKIGLANATATDVGFSGNVFSGNATFPVLIIHLATLSPDAYNIVRQRTESLGEEDEAIVSSFWGFVFAVYHKLVMTTRTLALVLTLASIVWLFGSYFFLSWVYSAFERSPFPYLSLATYMLKAMLTVVIFFLPLPDGSVTVGTESHQVFTPLFVKAIRASAEWGNAIADEVAKDVGKNYTEFLFKVMNKKAYRDLEQKEELLVAMYDELAQKELSIVENCYKVYDTKTFLLPRELLEEINFRPDAGSGAKKTCWSLDACKQEEESYLKMIFDYNKRYLRYQVFKEGLFSSSELAEGLSEKYSKFSKKYGWLAFPLGYVTGVSSVVYNKVLEMAEAITPETTGDEGGSWFQRVWRQVKKQGDRFVKWAFRQVVLTALPPGSMIRKGVDEAVRKVLGGLASLAGGGLVGSTAGRLLVSAASAGASLILSAQIAMMFLHIMIFLSLILGFTFRYLAYVIELVKVVFITPFIVIWSFTLRRYDRVSVYTGKLLQMFAYPMMMLISVFMALFVQGIITAIVYQIPLEAVDIIQSSSLLRAGMWGVHYLVKYALYGVFYWMVLVSTAVANFIVTFQGPEWMLEAFGRWEGTWQQPVQAARAMLERVAVGTRIISGV